MERELDTFQLPPSFKHKLNDAGYLTVADIRNTGPVDLSKELGVSRDEALEILETVRGRRAGASNVDSRSMTAYDMLTNEKLQQAIITFSEAVDNMLGGGVPLTKVTEICGAPGVGKTQLSIQLAVDVQIPECFGGVDGEAVYIDTEGSFVVARVVDVAKACIDHCKEIAESADTNGSTTALEELTLEKMLGRIHYFRCLDYVQLLAVVHLLDKFLAEHPKVKLVVVDSIAFPFRHDFTDMALRTRLLNGLAQKFLRYATDHMLAVVLVNQMTTKFGSGKSGQSYLVPALGESWGHASTIRVILYWENSQRFARLYKSPSKEQASVPYQITLSGIRDVTSDSTGFDQEEEIGQPAKRQKLEETAE